MKLVIVLSVILVAGAMLPAATIAAEASPCSSSFHAVAAIQSTGKASKAGAANRIERVDVREAESSKGWYSTVPSLGFFYGRLAPRNSALFG